MRYLCCFFLFALVAVAHAEPDALDSALSAIGMTRAGFHVDSEVMLTRNATTTHRLPVFDQWFQHPLRIPFWERHIRTTLLQTEGKLHQLFNSCSSILSMGTRRDLIPPTPVDKYRARAKEENALSNAIHELDPSARVPKVDNIPRVIQQCTAMVLFAMNDAAKWRQLALQDVISHSGDVMPPSQQYPTMSPFSANNTVKWHNAFMQGMMDTLLQELYVGLSVPLEHSVKDTGATADTLFPDSYKNFLLQQKRLDAIDLRLLFSAADDLTGVIDTVVATLSSMPDTVAFHFRCPTKLGTITLTSDGNNVHNPSDDVLLIVDLNGNDVYRTGGGTMDSRHPLSIVIDMQGDDRYESLGLPAFGCGILGYGILVDAIGNDHYTSAGFYAQGCGLAGVGLLHDMSGDDTYDAIGASQGFGMFGVGILSDDSGQDTYHSYTESQGCGMTKGFGLLLDLAGNDMYTADDSDIIFPSPQSDKHNSSMCQGAGYGIRRDYLDAHSLAGGVGMLLDGEGNDTYSGGVFSQAVGYWYGIGILDDRSGNDRYNAVWYGQSATAHMGLSYLDDGSGDDTYSATMSVSGGAAHDFSASLFVDEAGNDSYPHAANALGRSLNSSVALFADLAGDDHYQGTESLGQSVNFSSAGLRAEILSAALFLDLNGNDTYPKGTGANSSMWIQKSDTPLPLLKGVGLDSQTLKVRWDDSDR